MSRMNSRIGFPFLVASFACLALSACSDSGYQICYSGMVLTGDVSETTFDGVDGGPIGNAVVEVYSEETENVYGMQLALGGRYGDGDSVEPFCTPELGAYCEIGSHCAGAKEMRIRFSADGCDTLVYTPDIHEHLDQAPPTPSADVTLNAKLRCD